MSDDLAIRITKLEADFAGMRKSDEVGDRKHEENIKTMGEVKTSMAVMEANFAPLKTDVGIVRASMHEMRGQMATVAAEQIEGGKARAAGFEVLNIAIGKIETTFNQYKEGIGKRIEDYGTRITTMETYLKIMAWIMGLVVAGFVTQIIQSWGQNHR